MQPTNIDRRIAMDYLQEARELIALAQNRMETETPIISKDRNAIECELWDLMLSTREIIGKIASEIKQVNSN